MPKAFILLRLSSDMTAFRQLNHLSLSLFSNSLSYFKKNPFSKHVVCRVGTVVSK